jgi:Leucine-rich repeat (LRR) protein
LSAKQSQNCTGESAQLEPSECLAWGQFFDDLDGLSWEPCSDKRADPCACAGDLGRGVICIDGHITTVNLENFELQGTLSATIGQFPKLKSLTLRGNEIHGSLPAEIAQLGDVTRIDLDNNQISGLVPDLSRMTSLEFVKMFSNQLSGPVPPSVTTLTNLQQLMLSNNELTGTIPDLSSLQALTLL